ncbi:MAG: hypothetical protein AAGB19_22610 [Cyanobacteria bacterium P01_F01_bin.3]
MMKNLLNKIKKKRAGKPTPASSVESTSPRRGAAGEFADTYRERQGARQEKLLEKDREKHVHQRREKRSRSFTVASLSMPDRGFSIDGVILEASKNGLTFRSATNYIENRIDEPIQLMVGAISRNGIIRSTRPDGYGVQLFEPLTDEDLSFVQEQSVDLNAYEAA